MSQRILAFFVALIVSTSLPATASPTDQSRPVNPRVVQLFELSGLESQLSVIEPQLLFGLNEAMGNSDSEVATQIRTVVKQQFAHRALHKRTLNAIDDSWHAKHAQVTLDWLSSDLGRNITQAEEYASTMDGMTAMNTFDVDTRDPDKLQRRDLSDRIKATFGGTDYAVDANLAVSLALAYGANAAQPPGGQLTQEMIRGFVEMGRNELFSQLDTFLDHYLLFTYSKLTMKELTQYVDFLESDAGRWYSDTVKDAYVSSLLHMSQEIGYQMQRVISESSAKATL